MLEVVRNRNIASTLLKMASYSEEEERQQALRETRDTSQAAANDPEIQQLLHSDPLAAVFGPDLSLPPRLLGLLGLSNNDGASRRNAVDPTGDDDTATADDDVVLDPCSNELQQRAPAVASLSNVTSIRVGTFHSDALLAKTQ